VNWPDPDEIRSSYALMAREATRGLITGLAATIVLALIVLAVSLFT
jgi:hypothetical protein